MQVDWVTVAAQVVNFLILVYILKRFLYRPVQTAMERRRQQIAERLQEAERREQAADEARLDYERQARALEHSKETLLLDARDQVQSERKAWLDEARHEVEVARQDWRHDLERERADTHNRLRTAIAECALDTARHLLAELADARLEQRMVERFLERMTSLDADRLRELGKAPGPVRIRSVFELEPAMRSRISRTVRAKVSDAADIEFTLAPGLLGGLELSAGGLRIGWNLADHLEGLELRLGTTMRSRVAEDEPPQGESVHETISEDLPNTEPVRG